MCGVTIKFFALLKVLKFSEDLGGFDFLRH